MQALFAWYHSMLGWYHWRTESTLARIECAEPLGIIFRFAGIHLRITGTLNPEYSVGSEEIGEEEKGHPNSEEKG